MSGCVVGMHNRWGDGSRAYVGSKLGKYSAVGIAVKLEAQPKTRKMYESSIEQVWPAL
jgi:hypothetical protein